MIVWTIIENNLLYFSKLLHYLHQGIGISHGYSKGHLYIEENVQFEKTLLYFFPCPLLGSVINSLARWAIARDTLYIILLVVILCIPTKSPTMISINNICARVMASLRIYFYFKIWVKLGYKFTHCSNWVYTSIFDRSG